MEAGINENLVSVFRSISQSQSTGILYVYEGENIKYLYFEGGKLIYLSFYVSKSEKIGRALIDAYKVSAENLQEAFDAAASQGVELKNILLEKNLITPDEFKDVTRTLVEDEFCEMFQWNNSQTSFVEGEPDPQIFNKDYNTLKINIDVENLIKWIQKKVDENYTILQWIPGKANIYALIGDVYDSLDQTSLGPFDMQVAEFLDGNYSLENICYQLRQNFYKVGKSIVKLLSLGAAELISGQGPTTGISDEISKIQGGTGIAPTTPTPPADGGPRGPRRHTGRGPSRTCFGAGNRC
ncbi:DUF4388 domain-containing protein [Planctomycetota bacterium]